MSPQAGYHSNVRFDVRAVHALAGSLLLACAVASASTQSLISPADWTQFRLHPSNNAVLGGTLSASWHVLTPGAFSSSPTIADGTLYAGNNDGALLALDPATGKVKWQYHVSNPIMSAPLIYGNLVIVGEGNENSPDGSSPSHPIRVGAPPNAIVALDRRTGAKAWRVDLPGTGMPTPAVIGGVLLHHNGAGRLQALVPATGRTRYVRDLHSIASMTAILPISGSRFVTAGIDPNAVWEIDANDGTVVWRSMFSRVASALGDCPAVTDGMNVYCDYVMPPSSAVPVQTERQAVFRAYALNVRTGKKVWDVELDRGMLPKRNEAAIPLLANRTLYVGSSLVPYVHAVDPATGKLKWRAATHGPVKGGIVSTGGAIYFGDLGGYLWALDAKTGRRIGARNMHVPFNVGSPIVAGRTLIIGSASGTLLAVPLASVRAGRDG